MCLIESIKRRMTPDQIERLVGRVWSLILWIEVCLFFVCCKIVVQTVCNSVWFVDMMRH